MSFTAMHILLGHRVLKCDSASLAMPQKDCCLPCRSNNLYLFCSVRLGVYSTGSDSSPKLSPGQGGPGSGNDETYLAAFCLRITGSYVSGTSYVKTLWVEAIICDEGDIHTTNTANACTKIQIISVQNVHRQLVFYAVVSGVHYKCTHENHSDLLDWWSRLWLGQA